jgi:MYXO-CTERM domain-containing protein
MIRDAVTSFTTFIAPPPDAGFPDAGTQPAEDAGTSDVPDAGAEPDPDGIDLGGGDGDASGDPPLPASVDGCGGCDCRSAPGNASLMGLAFVLLLVARMRRK